MNLNINKKDLFEKISYAKLFIFHPFKGAWALKRENKGSITMASVFVILVILMNILRRQLTGYVINFNILNDINIMIMITSVILPFSLWCISNWCFTTLMDGEGTMRDIAIVTAYSLLPIIILNIPLIVLSNVITIEEGAFYYIIDTIISLWVAFLIFTGIMTTHQFSISKTIATFILAIIGMGIIVCLGLLFFALIQQIVNFSVLIYNELALRK